jgi:hypothetical protein
MLLEQLEGFYNSLRRANQNRKKPRSGVAAG